MNNKNFNHIVTYYKNNRQIKLSATLPTQYIVPVMAGDLIKFKNHTLTVPKDGFLFLKDMNVYEKPTDVPF